MDSSGCVLSQTFTIEPMLNLGTNWDLIHWPDNWTATTVDGKRSAQFEETLLYVWSPLELVMRLLVADCVGMSL